MIQENKATGCENPTKSRLIERRNVIKAFAAAGVVAASPVFAGTPGVVRGAGDIRKVNMVNDRTGEMIDMVYWVDGQYVPEALQAVNYFFRDWRRDAVKSIDPMEVDLIAATHKLLGTNEPFLMISGYRSPETNRAVGGARNSYHIRGQAADLRLRSRSVRQMSGAAMSVNAGGVGTYYRSNFMHIDSGPRRSWNG